jgi:hypothetical protein
MHHVPPELLSTILGYVDEAQDHRICHYAPVSQIWKAAVEHVTFRSLRLSSSDLDAFQEAFEGNKCSRREHLRHIYIQCPFPEFEQESQDKCCKVTRKFISEADSTTWSGLIGRLFLTLGDITQRYGVQAEKLPLISLNFLSKKKYPYEENYESRCRFRKHSEREIEEARAKPGTIKLRGSQLLPSLSFVSSLSAHCHGESQFLHPSWIGELAEKLPKLQDVHISVEDAYNWGTNWRKQYHRGSCDIHSQL